MAPSSHSLFLTLLVTLNVPGIFARKGSGGGSIHFSLDLGSVDSATFSFYVIFTVLTALQAIQAMSAMGRRRQEEDFPRRLLFIVLTFIGVLSLITSYALSAVLQSQINTITLPSLNYAVISSMLGFVHMLTYIFLYAALLLLLDYRSTVQALQYGHSKSRNFVIALQAASAMLLLLMFIAALARAIIGSTQILTYYFGEQEPLATRVYDGLYHLFDACNIVITAVICGASGVLWTNRRPMDSQYNWLLFDTNVSTCRTSLIDHPFCFWLPV